MAVMAAGQMGAGGYLTLRRLIVWLAEPQIRMRGLAGIADATAHLEGGALINAVDALAQHGDSLVQHFVSRTLQQMCQPLFQMAREWVFDGRLTNAGSEFFITNTGKCHTLVFDKVSADHVPVTWCMCDVIPCHCQGLPW